MQRPKSPTPKMRRFAKEYLVDFSCEKAALRAGYSPRTANKIGWQVLQKPAVAALIKEGFEAIQKRTELDQDWVISRYKMLADYDPLDLYDAEGMPLPMAEVPAKARYAIQGIDVISLGEKGTVQKIKMANKESALDSLGKHLGIFEKDNQQKNDIKIRVRVKNADD